jgi:hypothetical protein
MKIDDYLKQLQEQNVISRMGTGIARAAKSTAAAVVAPTDKKMALNMCYQKYCFEPYKDTNINVLYNKKNQEVCKQKCYLNYLKQYRQEVEQDMSQTNYVGVMLKQRQYKLKMLDWEISRAAQKIKTMGMG